MCDEGKSWEKAVGESGGRRAGVGIPPSFGHVSEYSRLGRKWCHSSRVRFFPLAARSFGCQKSLATLFSPLTRRILPQGSKPTHEEEPS